MKYLLLSTAITLSLATTPLLANDKPGEGVTVRPVVGLIAEEYFQSRILFRALADLGYTVAEPLEAEIQTAHLAVGAGDADFYPIHWGALHQGFFDESGGDAVLEKVGPMVAGAVQGYLVDKATYDSGVQSLGDLKDPAVAAKFDSDGDGKADLAGCVPGWGCERVIEANLDRFGLRDTVSHNQGAYNAIIADTIARYETGKPILYYTWTPYWVSGTLVPGKDVEWLSVPGEGDETTIYNGKNLGFTLDSMYVLTTDAFLEANPAAAKLFELIKVDVNDVSAENKQMANGETSSEAIDDHVSAWIFGHQAEYDGWLAAARAVSE